MNALACLAVSFVQYVIVMLSAILAQESRRPVDWLITLSWAMTATLWLWQGVSAL